MPTDHRKRKKLCSSSCNKAKEVLIALSGKECVALTYTIVMLSSPTYLSIAPGSTEKITDFPYPVGSTRAYFSSEEGHNSFLLFVSLSLPSSLALSYIPL